MANSQEDKLRYGNRAVLDEAIGQGIPIVIFHSEAPKDLHLTSVGND